MNQAQTRSRESNERGHLLVALMVLVACMLILLTVTGQSWTFITQRDREAEMIFRGEQYARALDFYRKEMGSYPLELKLLSQPGPHRHRYIRKLWKDPVSKDGKWGLLYLSPTGKGYINPYATQRDQEQFIAGAFGDKGPGGGSGSGFNRSGSPPGLGKGHGTNEDGEQPGGYTEMSKDEFEARGGEKSGLPIVGVVHKRKESGFRIYKNQANLNDWAFTILAEGEQQEIKAAGGGGTPGGFQNRGVGDVTTPITLGGRKPPPGGGNVNPAKEQMRRDKEKRDQEEKERREKEQQENGDQEQAQPDDDDDSEDEPADDQTEDEKDPNAPVDPNAPADPNAPKDPNAPHHAQSLNVTDYR